MERYRGIVCHRHVLLKMTDTTTETTSCNDLLDEHKHVIEYIVDTYCPRLTPTLSGMEERHAYCTPECRKYGDINGHVFETFQVCWDKMLVEIVKATDVRGLDWESSCDYARYVFLKSILDGEIPLNDLRPFIQNRDYIYSRNRKFDSGESGGRDRDGLIQFEKLATQWETSICAANLVQWSTDVHLFLESKGLSSMSQYYRKGARTRVFQRCGTSSDETLDRSIYDMLIKKHISKIVDYRCQPQPLSYHNIAYSLSEGYNATGNDLHNFGCAIKYRWDKIVKAESIANLEYAFTQEDLQRISEHLQTRHGNISSQVTPTPSPSVIPDSQSES